jgi:AcrR family transcriptional regulator
MRDIARATGVSLSGLYHYCKSKEELLFLIQDNCFGHVLERLEERLADATEPEQKLRILIENHLAFFAANMAEMKVLSHEAESLGGELHLRVSGKKERYTKLARRILTEVQQEKPRAEPRLDLTVATYALFGMMNWIYNWYNPRGKLSVADLVDNVMRLYLGGFLNESTEKRDFPVPSAKEGLSIWREPQPKSA